MKVQMAKVLTEAFSKTNKIIGHCAACILGLQVTDLLFSYTVFTFKFILDNDTVKYELGHPRVDFKINTV